MKQLVKKYPGVLVLINTALTGSRMSPGDMAAYCDTDKSTMRTKILPTLLREGVLVRHNLLYKAGTANFTKLLRQFGVEAIEYNNITSLDGLIAIPNMANLIKFMLSAKTITTKDVADVLSIAKNQAKDVISCMKTLGLVAPYYNSSFKPGDLTELCEKLGMSVQDEKISSHKKGLVPWKWFVEDKNRLRVVLMVVGADEHGRHIDSVKASVIAGQLGVSKSEFVASYAPTLIAEGAISQVGKNYKPGPKFREYVSILVAKADNGLLPIGKMRKPKPPTAAQKRKMAEVTEKSVKTMEKRRKDALTNAKEWYDGGLYTKKEYELLTGEINEQYDASIKNLTQPSKRSKEYDKEEAVD